MNVFTCPSQRPRSFRHLLFDTIETLLPLYVLLLALWLMQQ